MTVSDWARHFINDLSKSPYKAMLRAIYDGYVGGLRRVPAPTGTNPLNDDWQVLTILDACRPDLLSEVTGEYSWLPDGDHVQKRRSPAGRSDDWMNTVFEEDTKDVIYITGNPFAANHVNDADFKDIIHAYKNHWDSDRDVMPPRPITDYAVAAARENDMNNTRLIIHYMQPHFPSIPAIERGDPTFGRGGLYKRWRRVRENEINENEVVSAYKDNLRYVLNEVGLLRENIPVSNMVITSDHGTALGEWGVYGHSGLPISAVRNVPWISVPTEDIGSHTPEVTLADNEETAVKDQLSALGYR
ncbi:hypothetical protein [Haloparvum sp. AD34]